MIFGRRGCSEKRNYLIKIYFDDNGEPKRFSDQLTKKDATAIYEELKQKYANKGDSIEILYDNDTYYLLKKHIICIRLQVDC